MGDWERVLEWQPRYFMDTLLELPLDRRLDLLPFVAAFLDLLRTCRFIVFRLSMVFFRSMLAIKSHSSTTCTVRTGVGAGASSYLGQTPDAALGLTLRPGVLFLATVTKTPLGGAVGCARVEILESLFRSQRTLSAHPSPLGSGVLSSSMSAAPVG